MQDGVQDVDNTRYKQEILARTRAGMERNTAIEQAQQGMLKPDGTLDEEKWAQYANYDPKAALEIRDSLKPKKGAWELKQVGDGTPGGLLDVWVNPATQEMRDLQGQVISGGLLGQDGPQAQQQPNSGPGALDLSAGPESWYASIGEAVKPFGGTIGSTTGGQHNVGSLHGSGNAVDIPLGDWRNISPENQQAMIDRLSQQPGIKVRDERQRPAGQKVWGGPHLHVERSTAQAAPSPMQSRIGRRPAKPAAATGAEAGDKAANWQIVQGNDGSFVRVNKLTGEEVKTGVQGSNAARIQKMEQERVGKV